jgi:hypothetical protein
MQVAYGCIGDIQAYGALNGGNMEEYEWTRPNLKKYLFSALLSKI